MSAYSFSALDNIGKTHNGVLEADSTRHARELIRLKGWVPLGVDEGGSQPATDNATLSSRLFQRKISNQELSLITRQLATLVQSGMPIEECLVTISAQAEKQSSKLLIQSIRSKVLEGFSLAEALRQQSSSFPATYSEMVAAGEHSGYLDTVLEQLADHLETATDSQQKVKLALVYPGMLLLVSLLMVLGLLTYVVPQVVGVFADQNATLPPLTQALITISEVLQSYWLVMSLSCFALFLLVRWLLKQASVKLRFDRWLLKSALTRKLVRASCTAQFSSTLSILVRSGIPLVDAMKIARQVLSNTWLRSGLQTSIQKLQEGVSLNVALQQGGDFSPMLLHMIASGEASGELGHMLSKAAEHEQRSLDFTINGSLKLLEPAILLFIGGLIFTIVLAILQPIFELNQLI
ncbi:MAG: type II secretion system inner membrane protein GspF [Pseudomonadales bacterium]